MKNLIKVLLYVLLGLLVVAIAMVIYKKSADRADVADATTDQVDSLFYDAKAAQAPMSPEDSMILELTGELPSQTGTMANNNSTIDYTIPAATDPAAAPENTSPKAQPVSNPVRESNKASSASGQRAGSQKGADEETKKKSIGDGRAVAGLPTTSESGKFFAIAGSFIVPSHADKLVETLKKKGFKNCKKRIFGDSEYYSVAAGQYATREEASKAVASLKSLGYKDAFIKTAN